MGSYPISIGLTASPFKHMKNQLTAISFALALACSLTSTSSAKPTLNTDPEVVYLEDYSAKPITFLTTEAIPVYASKKGKKSRKLGTFQAGSRLTLLAMNETAYRISGKGKFGKLKGWVNPKKLASKDPKFIENLQKLYKRQMLIRQLIANKQVAIGMTIDEVIQSLGKPTTKESRVTREGRSGKWEFIEYEQQKHYNYVRDPHTGRTYRKLSHITTEEKSKITVEFASNIVTAITSKEDNGPGKIRIITPPILFGF